MKGLLTKDFLTVKKKYGIGHSVKSCVSDIRQNQRMTLNWTHSVA